ncbi:hypothetical protein HMPREF3226_02430 [Prevotella corporis]|uniref:Uncharacterized protein n=1 Tax=Prevotella corporis TaxID=28128 RepID=A0A133PVW8_9BACT|nr:hypothetical protein HMPREF3226_02430 [Prevotella corporis]
MFSSGINSEANRELGRFVFSASYSFSGSWVWMRLSSLFTKLSQ